MNCPHCLRAIDDSLVAAAHNRAAAARPRPGARGLVRNPAGKNRPQRKRGPRSAAGKEAK
jgi:hypothetical protein